MMQESTRVTRRAAGVMQEWMQECSRSQWECWSSGQSVGGVEGLSRSAAAVSTIVSGVHATGMQQESADATGVQQEPCWSAARVSRSERECCSSKQEW